jgi:hypothetical protein
MKNKEAKRLITKVFCVFIYGCNREHIVSSIPKLQNKLYLLLPFLGTQNVRDNQPVRDLKTLRPLH